LHGFRKEAIRITATIIRTTIITIITIIIKIIIIIIIIIKQIRHDDL